MLDLWLRAARRGGAEVITLNPAGSVALRPGSAAWAAAELQAESPAEELRGREGQPRRGRARRDRLVGGRSRRAEPTRSLWRRPSAARRPSTSSRARRTGAASRRPGATPGTVPEGEIGALIVSGDEAAGNPAVRDLAERARFVLTTAMFESEGTLWSHLVVPGTSYLERDGTTVNLEGRPQRQRRAVAPPSEDELAFFASLAGRFGVEVDPWPGMLPDDHAALPETERAEACHSGAQGARPEIGRQGPRARPLPLALQRAGGRARPAASVPAPASPRSSSPTRTRPSAGSAAEPTVDGALERDEPHAPRPGEPAAPRRRRPHPVRAREGLHDRVEVTSA